MHSDLYTVPGLSTELAEALCCLGYTDLESLIGQNPQALCRRIRLFNPKVTEKGLSAIARAVYCAETPNPDPHKLRASYWQAR